jgi:uncharacterized protein YaaN involved in tellurite resistance
VSERIASKIRSEHALQHDIMSTERSYRDLKAGTENLEQTIKQRELAVSQCSQRIICCCRRAVTDSRVAVKQTRGPRLTL